MVNGHRAWFSSVVSGTDHQGGPLEGGVMLSCATRVATRFAPRLLGYGRRV